MNYVIYIDIGTSDVPNVLICSSNDSERGDKPVRCVTSSLVAVAVTGEASPYDDIFAMDYYKKLLSQHLTLCLFVTQVQKNTIMAMNLS